MKTTRTTRIQAFLKKFPGGTHGECQEALGETFSSCRFSEAQEPIRAAAAGFAVGHPGAPGRFRLYLGKHPQATREKAMQDLQEYIGRTTFSYIKKHPHKVSGVGGHEVLKTQTKEPYQGGQTKKFVAPAEGTKGAGALAFLRSHPTGTHMDCRKAGIEIHSSDFSRIRMAFAETPEGRRLGIPRGRVNGYASGATAPLSQKVVSPTETTKETPVKGAKALQILDFLRAHPTGTRAECEKFYGVPIPTTFSRLRMAFAETPEGLKIGVPRGSRPYRKSGHGMNGHSVVPHKRVSQVRCGASIFEIPSDPDKAEIAYLQWFREGQFKGWFERAHDEIGA